jgi:hypothetical protein
MSEPTYTVRLIIAQYKQSYPHELMPNVVDAWDEYTMDSNPEGYQEALDKHRAKEGDDYEYGGVRELIVELPQSAVTKLFDPVTVSFKEN